MAVKHDLCNTDTELFFPRLALFLHIPLKVRYPMSLFRLGDNRYAVFGAYLVR